MDDNIKDKSEITTNIDDKIELCPKSVKDRGDSKFSQNALPIFTHLPFPRNNNNISPFHGNERIEDWIYIVELILEGHGVTQDKSKILFASSYLRDSALHEYQAFTKDIDKNTKVGFSLKQC